MSKSKKKKVVGAPLIMKKRGEITDNEILRYVESNPHCTVKELSEKLYMNKGRIDGSLNRLYKDGLINIQYFRKNNILTKSISLVDALPKKYDEVYFPIDLIDDDIWQEKVFFCATSRSAIKISPILKEKMKESCAFMDRIKVKKQDDKLVLKIPDKFVNFYELPNSEIDISGYKDEILLSVESTIIPIEAPFDYIDFDDPTILRGRITFDMHARAELEFIGRQPRDTSSENDFNDLEDLIKGIEVHLVSSETKKRELEENV